MNQLSQVSSRISGVPGFWEFVRTRYPLPKHIIYAVVWYSALNGSLAILHPQGEAWHLPTAILSVVTVVLLFFFLRAVDEIKDLEYDKQHNPDRALVRGVVTILDVAGYLVGTSILILGINALYSSSMALAAALIMVLSLGLLGLEHLSARFESSMFVNTGVSIQLKTGTALYLYLGYLRMSGQSAAWVDLAVIAGLILAYLHWEVARKIVWPEFAIRGEKLYSNEAGVYGGTAIAFGLLFGALALLLLAFQPWNTVGARSVLGWMPGLSLLPSCYGAVRFFAKKDKRRTMAAFTLVGYLVLLFALIGQGLWIGG